MAPPECRAAPAPPGFRDAESNRGYGALRNVGNLGYIWSSSILSRSGYAHYLSFNYAGIGPQSYNHRAYGFQLRCLQEHPKGVLLAIRRRKTQLSRAERHPRRHPRRRAQPRQARFCPRWLRGAYLCLPTGYKTFSKKVRTCSVRNSARTLSAHCRLVETGGRRHPRRKAGAARHAKTGICSDKPAGVGRKTAIHNKPRP